MLAVVVVVEHLREELVVLAVVVMAVRLEIMVCLEH